MSAFFLPSSTLRETCDPLEKALYRNTITHNSQVFPDKVVVDALDVWQHALDLETLIEEDVPRFVAWCCTRTILMGIKYQVCIIKASLKYWRFRGRTTDLPYLGEAPDEFFQTLKHLLNAVEVPEDLSRLDEEERANIRVFKF